jgi:hypothetical protein
MASRWSSYDPAAIPQVTPIDAEGRDGLCVLRPGATIGAVGEHDEQFRRRARGRRRRITIDLSSRPERPEPPPTKALVTQGGRGVVPGSLDRLDMNEQLRRAAWDACGLRQRLA